MEAKFEYFDHEADIGIVGYGKNLEEAFEQGAKAMFNIMADINNIELKKEIKIKVEAPDEETLFIEWLNSLLAQKDIENLLFSEFEVKIKKVENKFVLEGIAKGEEMNYEKHQIDTEVKAATYSQLKIEKVNNIYKVQCVVDV
jgi:SHS2 domain-containing protein